MDGFRFRHVLIREAAYDLGKSLRAEMHEGYAAWLKEVAGDRLPELEEVLGYHLEQAHRYRLEVLKEDEHGRAVALRAGTRLASAGRRALAKGDAPAAVNLLDASAGAFRQPAGAQLGPALDLGIALGEAGNSSRGPTRCWARRCGGARGRGDRRVELTAVVGRAGIALLSDPERVGSLVGDVEAALPELVEIGDDRALAIGWRIIRLRCGARGSAGSRWPEAYERALVHARAAKTPGRRQTSCASSPSRAVWGPRPGRRGDAAVPEILDEAAGDPLIEAGTLRSLSSLEARRRRFEQSAGARTPC